MKHPWKLAKVLVVAALVAGVFNLATTDKTTAAAPTTISFQGKIVNASDSTNVSGSSYSVTFKLYTASSGGTAAWTETQTVTTTNGIFQVNLGSSCAFFTPASCNNSTALDFSANSYYLTMTVSGDTEMTPRIPLQQVPNAFYANNAGQLGGLTASQFVQLSPSIQQSGYINVSGNSTIGGTLTVSSTINTDTLTGSALTFGTAGTATIQPAASQALTITAHAASTWSTDSGDLTLQAGSGTVSLGSSTVLTNSSGGLIISSGGSGGLTLTSGSGTISTGSAISSTNTITGTTLNGTTGINTGSGAGTNRITSGGNLVNIGTIAAALSGGSAQFNVDASGDVTGLATAVAGVSSTTNGTSGLGTSMSLVLTNATSFTVGDYVQINDTNCGGTGINPCYAKITAKATNTLTITPALTWTTGKTVNEYIFPEIGGNEVVTPTLLSRYGRAWFISGVATGNGTTYYNEDGISTSLTTYNIAADSTSGVTTLNIGNANTTAITLGTSGTTTKIAGSLQTSNNGNINAGTGALQGGSLSISSGAFAVNSSGAITAATGLTSSGTIILSGLNATGVVHTNASGQLSTSAVLLGTDTSGNYVAGLGALTGLSASASSGVGISPTLSVLYGSTTNTAVQGSVQFTCPSASTNLSGGGTVITEGSGGTCASLAVVSSPSFSGSVTAGTGLTVTTGGATINGNISLGSTTTQIQRTATGSLTLDLNDTANTTLILKNSGSGVANLNLFGGSLTTGSTPVTRIDNSGNYTGGTVTGTTINATTAIQANGTAGQSFSCGAGQYINTAVVSEGIVTGHSACTNVNLSDERLKTNIVTLDSSILERIGQVHTVNFDFDCTNTYFADTDTYCDPNPQTGVLAQEIQQIFPDLIREDAYGYYSVNYQGLSVYTLKAVSQLAQHIDAEGNGTFNNLTVNGTLTYASTQTDNGNFTNSVVTPALSSNGALAITSGGAGDVTIDTGSTTGNVNIGTSNAANVNIGRTGQKTTVNGSLEVVGGANVSGPVNLTFSDGESLNLAAPTANPTSNVFNSGAFSVTAAGDIAAKSVSSKGNFVVFDSNGNQVVSMDTSGNANFNGTLTAAAITSNGALSVGGDANFAGLSSFQKLATFFGKVIFRQDVSFQGHVTVASDTAGYAKLTAGESKVHVAFTNPYEQAPVVNVSPTDGQFVVYSINNITTTGFDITLATPAANDLTLSWTAFGASNPQTAANPPATP